MLASWGLTRAATTRMSRHLINLLVCSCQASTSSSDAAMPVFALRRSLTVYVPDVQGRGEMSSCGGCGQRTARDAPFAIHKVLNFWHGMLNIRGALIAHDNT